MSRAILRMMLVVAFMPVLAVAENPFNGTWKYDQSKTVRSAEKPFVLLLQDGMYEVTSDKSVKADGGDQPVSGIPYFDAVAVQIVSDHEMKLTEKKNGREVFSSTGTVSSDGKTLTETFTMKAPKGGPPVIGKFEYTRIAAGPAGSHAISGSWELSKVETSDNGRLFTFRIDGDQICYSTPTGEAYIAKLDGTDAPFSGTDAPFGRNGGITSVSVQKLGNDTLEITTKRDGKVISVSTMTVSPDGKTIKQSVQSKVSDWKSESVAVKQ